MKNWTMPLTTKLAVVLLLKLLVLAGLWWIFVRDQNVAVDATQVMQQFLSSDPGGSKGVLP